MGKEGNSIVGGDDGIGKVKQEVEGSSRESSAGGDVAESRVWTMQDLYKHPSARGYSRDLYNFAWARAVQKKPLDEAVLSNVDESLKVPGDGGVVKLAEEVKDSIEGLVGADGHRNQIGVDKVESDEGESEKEEGELEEGEIDMDVNMNMDMDMGGDKEAKVQTDESGKEEKEEDFIYEAVEGEMELDCGQIDAMDFDERMLAILETLESVTTAEVEKSFEGVCSELLNALKSMRELVLVLAVPAMDTLVQLFLTAVTTVDAIQDMMPKMAASDSRGAGEKDMNISKVAVKENTVTTQFPKKPLNNSSRNGYPSSKDLMALPETLKISTSRGKGIAPLLDLHKDHDLDSLHLPQVNPR